jgi:hypothetical protein
MRVASPLSVIGAAIWFAGSSAHAVGFGRVVNATQLGQPLNFAAAIRLDTDEELPRECVSAEVQSGDNKLLPVQVRVTLEGAAESADRSVRITTSALIDEPVVTVSVTLGCASKVTRRFVAFIDPPTINAAQTMPTETLAPQRVDSQVAPILRTVQGENPSASRPAIGSRDAGAPRNRARTRVATGASDAPADAAPKPAAQRPARSAPRAAQVARAPQAGPRLQLEAAAPVVTPSASSPPIVLTAPPVAVAASAAKPDEAAAQLALERQRILALEEGLARLRADSQANQNALLAMQVRLKEAESERYANPLVFALAWLSALLALAVAGLWWRQSRGRQSAQWWSGPLPVEAPARNIRPTPAPSEPVPLGATPTAADAFAVMTVDEDDEQPSPPPPRRSVETRPAPFSPTLPPIIEAEPARELSVEELIDLEQQVEFFIVLGQDEAAIELLMSHVRSDGGISPLPYLKLLEIYRRRGDGEAYQRIRERFNRRFNAYAPDWEADPKQGRELVDYPETMARLQSLWAAPSRVMETLDASLFRRNKSDETFDLPAYRELLFLYSIARDLAEHTSAVVGEDVDLLLPLDDVPDEPIERLSATAPGEFRQSDVMTMPLDLDVSFGPGNDTQAVETMPSALRRTPDQSNGTDSNFLDFDLDEPAKPPKAGSGNR